MSTTDPIDPRADTSIDPEGDAAQAEWDGLDVDEGPTATGADPAEIPADDDEIPAEDLPGSEVQPGTQDHDPLEAALGDDGQGDLAPEDL